MADRFIPIPFETVRREAVPYAKTVTITENKAPTDESIAIYGEMLDKARASLIEVITLKSSVVGEIAIAIYREMLDMNLTAHYRFVLNGETYTGKVVITNEWAQQPNFAELICMEVYNKFVEEVASKLFHAHINTAIAQKHSFT